MPAKASKGRKKGKKIEIPVYAQGSLTVDDLVQDSFEKTNLAHVEITK